MTKNKKCTLEVGSPLWEDVYGIESKRIAKILRSNVVDCYHIGSTAVTAIKARPIIDIMCVVHTLKGITAFNNEFERIGFTQSDLFEGKKRLFYIHYAKDGTPLCYLHIIEKTSSLVSTYLDFVHQLRSNDQFAKQYEETKVSLLEKYGEFNDSYYAGKKEFFERV